ncbi:TetR/AcrR family transcriptional regulator [Leucobacter sp. CSA2]|uniref:TetR/AcrR family transcriptional regulator n=1 Tax=Leucobacter edaphi TaxID=2796472 RepID=A0A934QEI7_9MICO|nr:TetR/AcrR family transcriptional regulator [Leucobacter edaphi]
MAVKERGGTVRGKQKRGLESRATLLESAAAIFAEKEYEGARLKDISEHAGISLGSLYFHFGNKEDVAKALLEQQSERMVQAFEAAVEGEDSPLERFLAARERLGALIAEDRIVQSGIRLRQSTSEELRKLGDAPDRHWAGMTVEMLQAAVDAGELSEDLDVATLAELLNEMFVGAQIMSGQRGEWSELTGRLERQRPYVSQLLGLPQ